MKRVYTVTVTALIVLLGVLALLLWGVRLFGMEAFVVQSGSMEPVHSVGSLVYVIKADAAALEVGDVITFRMTDGSRGTHRIVELVESNGAVAFRTKGDANKMTDNALVMPEDIIGKALFSIPYLGYVVAYIQQPPGIYAAVAVVAVLLLLMLLPDAFAKTKRRV